MRFIEGGAGITGVGPAIVDRVGELFEFVVIEHRTDSELGAAWFRPRPSITRPPNAAFFPTRASAQTFKRILPPLCHGGKKNFASIGPVSNVSSV